MNTESHSVHHCKDHLLQTVFFLSMAALGCDIDADSSPRPAIPGSQEPVRDKPATKKDLFADPRFVPTRRGEHHREELALSGEIHAALDAAFTFDELHVSVTFEATKVRSAVIAGVLSNTAPSTPVVTDQAISIAQTLATDLAADRIRIVLGRGPPQTPRRSFGLTLLAAVALIGFGASAGISIDRFRSKSTRLLTNTKLR